MVPFVPQRLPSVRSLTLLSSPLPLPIPPYILMETPRDANEKLAAESRKFCEAFALPPPMVEHHDTRATLFLNTAVLSADITVSTAFNMRHGAWHWSITDMKPRLVVVYSGYSVERAIHCLKFHLQDVAQRGVTGAKNTTHSRTGSTSSTETAK